MRTEPTPLALEVVACARARDFEDLVLFLSPLERSVQYALRASRSSRSLSASASASRAHSPPSLLEQIDDRPLRASAADVSVLANFQRTYFTGDSDLRTQNLGHFHTHFHNTCCAGCRGVSAEIRRGYDKPCRIVWILCVFM